MGDIYDYPANPTGHPVFDNLPTHQNNRNLRVINAIRQEHAMNTIFEAEQRYRQAIDTQEPPAIQKIYSDSLKYFAKFFQEFMPLYPQWKEQKQISLEAAKKQPPMYQTVPQKTQY